MPNIKSAIKRVKVSDKKAEQNKSIKTNLKTSVKNFTNNISAEGVNVKEEMSKVAKTLDKAAAKGIIHKKTASRKKSRLAKKINALAK